MDVFPALKLSPLAATLGALAATLEFHFFCDSLLGRGLAANRHRHGFFCAGLRGFQHNSETPALIRWMRLALAGLAVGINVIEAADIGAIFSLFVAGFVLVKAVADEGGPVWLKLGRGISRVAVIAVFAGFIATQTVVIAVQFFTSKALPVPDRMRKPKSRIGTLPRNGACPKWRRSVCLCRVCSATGRTRPKT